MDQLIRVLNSVKLRYGVYIGDKSISSLALFIAGFECAAYELTGIRIKFNAEFQNYVVQVYGEKNCNGKHWSTILAEGTTDAHAFDVFFTLLQSFQINDL